MPMDGSTDRYVLVVDDDSDARVLHSQIITALDLHAEAAADGKEALAHVNRKIPRLILLDLMMPGMDGFELLFRLQANPRTRDIPVVIVSAYTMGQQDLLTLPGVKKVIPKGSAIIPEVEAAVAALAGPAA